MAKEKYSKEEMKRIIEKAEHLKHRNEETYSKEDIEKIAKNMNIPKSMVKEAMKVYNRNSVTSKKRVSGHKVRKYKRYMIYTLYIMFWIVFISLIVIIPPTYENPWSSWVWLIPSIAFAGLITGAFINELEGAIIGAVAGGLSGILVIYLTNWIWGRITVGLVLGFVAFLVFLFRIKKQVDAVVK